MSDAVLVTGATGFLGRVLVAQLQGEGREVHAIARPGKGAEDLARRGVHVHPGELRNPPSLEEAARAVAARGPRPACIHAAAVISYRRQDAELARVVNLEGTRALLAGLRAAGFGRLVHVSSVVTVGHAGADGVLDEDAGFNAAGLGVDYVDTKRAAEELVLEQNAFEVVVVCPGAIFGPSGGGAEARVPNTTRFLASIASRRSGPLAPPGSLSVVGVEDTASGVRAALDGGVHGRRYLLTESSWSLLDLFRLGARATGAKPVRGAVPPFLWNAVVAGASALDRVKPLELATPQALRLLGLHFRFSSARARAELRWRPRPFAEVLDSILAEGLPS